MPNVSIRYGWKIWLSLSGIMKSYQILVLGFDGHNEN
jgi:hypothetical protein